MKACDYIGHDRLEIIGNKNRNVKFPVLFYIKLKKKTVFFPPSFVLVNCRGRSDESEKLPHHRRSCFGRGI